MTSLDEQGFCVVDDVLPAALAPSLRACFAEHVGERPGVRTGFDHAAVRELANSPRLRRLVEPWLGSEAFAFRATLFDKTPATNWLVAWHQDRTVPVVERTTDPGYGPWSDKPDGVHVQPPVGVLQRLLALRVDLDGSGPANGGLRVLPATHRHGVLAPAAIAACAAAQAACVPVVRAGGALVMRPLLLHASSRAVSAGHRRIVHLEFAMAPLPGAARFRACLRGSA